MASDLSFHEAEFAVALSAGRYEWRRHVLQRLAERGIEQSTVLDVIASGALIEEYPRDTPFPSALFLGWDETRPLHVVVALDSPNQWAYIITVYEPSPEHFRPDYRTRRRRDE